LVKLDIYQSFLNISSISDLVEVFKHGLIATNRTPQFFVDWEKVRTNVNKIKTELALWTSLIGSANIESDFINLITKYPEVIKTIPILLAIREREFPVIFDFLNIEKGTQELDFNKTRLSKLSNDEANAYLSFANNAGIFQLFTIVKNFYDYILGVEVGMDTNARKNRSGEAMELLVKPLIHQTANKFQCTYLFQRKFDSVKNLHEIPISLSNRKADFIVYSPKKFVNIEVNYYAGSGSKPEEIVDSYIHRSNELKASNWEFIWITDGNVWQGSEHQLRNAFNQLDYLLNIEFAKKGLLKKIFQNIFGGRQYRSLI